MPTVRLRGEEESDIISKEINYVINFKVHQEIGRELDLNKSEKSTLENEFLSITHRTYLWLTLIFNMIRRRRTGITKKKMKKLIDTLPNIVNKAYEAILEKSLDKNQTRKLLYIILSAVRPLTLKEMNIALTIEDKHISYQDLDLEAETKFKITVRNLCGLFVSVID